MTFYISFCPHINFIGFLRMNHQLSLQHSSICKGKKVALKNFHRSTFFAYHASFKNLTNFLKGKFFEFAYDFKSCCLGLRNINFMPAKCFASMCECTNEHFFCCEKTEPILFRKFNMIRTTLKVFLIDKLYI